MHHGRGEIQVWIVEKFGEDTDVQIVRDPRPLGRDKTFLAGERIAEDDVERQEEQQRKKEQEDDFRQVQPLATMTTHHAHDILLPIPVRRFWSTPNTTMTAVRMTVPAPPSPPTLIEYRCTSGGRAYGG